VNDQQTSDVLATMKAAYPSWKLDSETVSLWRSKLTNLAYDDAMLAVQSVVEDVRIAPAVADFFRHYSIVREQKAKAFKDEQRRLEQMAYENQPHLELREIAALPGVNAKWFQTGEAPIGRPLA
jgi:hypothetical protein